MPPIETSGTNWTYDTSTTWTNNTDDITFNASDYYSAPAQNPYTITADGWGRPWISFEPLPHVITTRHVPQLKLGMWLKIVNDCLLREVQHSEVYFNVDKNDPIIVQITARITSTGYNTCVITSNNNQIFDNKMEVYEEHIRHAIQRGNIEIIDGPEYDGIYAEGYREDE